MSIGITEAANAIKSVGPGNSRAIKMDGSDLYKVEICRNGSWITIVENLPARSATMLINESNSGKVILG